MEHFFPNSDVDDVVFRLKRLGIIWALASLAIGPVHAFSNVSGKINHKLYGGIVKTQKWVSNRIVDWIPGTMEESATKRISYKIEETLNGYRTVEMRKMFGNTADEAMNPRIGPSDRKISEWRHKIIAEGGGQRYTVEPLKVRATPLGYVILDGHHKWFASKQVRLREIRVKVIEYERANTSMSNIFELGTDYGR